MQYLRRTMCITLVVLASANAFSQTVIGTSNNDELEGNHVEGLNGQDNLYGTGLGDYLSAGDGDDLVYGYGGNDQLLGGSGQDRLYGGDGDDDLAGDDGDDRMYGGDGNDLFRGGQGQDLIEGGAGNDLFIGNSGDDTFYGGDGQDIFAIEPAGKNRIKDFQPGIDRLLLTGGLTYEDLVFIDRNNTVWVTTQNNQELAFIEGVTTSDIDQSTFGGQEDGVGNSVPESTITQFSSAGTRIEEWIGGNDPADYFAFIVGAENNVQVNLSGLFSNADVQILDYNNDVIAESLNADRAEEFIALNVSTGAYRLRVISDSPMATPYILEVSTVPLLEGITTTASPELNQLHTPQSLPLINYDDFISGNPAVGSDPSYATLTGQGWSVVIIDTGINLTYPFFGPDLDANGVADRIVFHMDFTNPLGPDIDGDMIPDGVDTNGHGTHVTGIALSQDGVFGGLAPGANIIHLKVFPDVPDPSASNADIESALQWVIENAAQFNIASINLSLGGDDIFNSHKSNSYGDELLKLSQLGIINIAAAGNDYAENGSAHGVAKPAADPNVINVGAVFDANLGNNLNFGGTSPAIAFTSDADRITPFSHRSAALNTVFAPGSLITNAALNGFPIAVPNPPVSMSGTSMAAPHVAGMAAVTQQLSIQEIGRRLLPSEFASLLRTTGTVITDGDDENDNVLHDGSNYSRVDMLALANAISELQTVTVTIHRVKGDYDDDIWPGTNESDFKGSIQIGDQVQSFGKVVGNDDLYPNWVMSRGVGGSQNVLIALRIQDEDRNGDDIIFDLNYIYDLVSGEIRTGSGQVIGNRGQQIIAYSHEDNDGQPGLMQFTVEGVGTHTPDPQPTGLSLHRFIYQNPSDSTPSFKNLRIDLVIDGVMTSYTRIATRNSDGSYEVLPDITELTTGTSGVAQISISLTETTTGTDIPIDLNPDSGLESLNLIYDSTSGVISDLNNSQVYGTRGLLNNLNGDAANANARLWFSVFGP